MDFLKVEGVYTPLPFQMPICCNCIYYYPSVYSIYIIIYRIFKDLFKQKVFVRSLEYPAKILNRHYQICFQHVAVYHQENGITH